MQLIYKVVVIDSSDGFIESDEDSTDGKKENPIDLSVPNFAAALEEKLNELGRHGWELVANPLDGVTLVFMKQKPLRLPDSGDGIGV